MTNNVYAEFVRSLSGNFCARNLNGWGLARYMFVPFIFVSSACLGQAAQSETEAIEIGYVVHDGAVYFGNLANAKNSDKLQHVDDLRVVPEANPSTFAILGEGYGKDANHAFIGDKVIKDAAPASFVLINGDYARDSTHVFHRDAGEMTVVAEADPKTFQVEKGNFSRDDKHVFYVTLSPGEYRTEILKGADPATFEASDEMYFKDAAHVFFRDDNQLLLSVSGVDVKTFEIVGCCYFRDKNAAYFKAKRLTARAAQFHDLTKGFGEYASDGVNTFFRDETIPGAKAKLPFFQDGIFSILEVNRKAYWNGQEIVGANPKTFQCFLSSTLRDLCEDKKHVFWRAVRIDGLLPRSPEQVSNDPRLLEKFEHAMAEKQAAASPIPGESSSIALPRIDLRATIRKLSAEVKEPESATELMLNMKKAWERGLPLREDFFSRKYASLFFGIIAPDFSETGEYADFSNFSFLKNAKHKKNGLAPLYFTYSKVAEKEMSPREANFSVVMELDAWDASLLPSYADIIKTFGPNWHHYALTQGAAVSDGGFREEPEAENHGYAHIEYSTETRGFVRSVEMSFDENAMLRHIAFSTKRKIRNG